MKLATLYRKIQEINKWSYEFEEYDLIDLHPISPDLSFVFGFLNSSIPIFKHGNGEINVQIQKTDDNEFIIYLTDYFTFTLIKLNDGALTIGRLSQIYSNKKYYAWSELFSDFALNNFESKNLHLSSTRNNSTESYPEFDAIKSYLKEQNFMKAFELQHELETKIK